MLCKEMNIADKIEKIQKLNEGIDIFSCFSDHFSEYGSILQGYNKDDFNVINNLEYENNGGVSYIPEIRELEDIVSIKDIGSTVFGEIPLQAGWCRGNNTAVKALEYHKSSEVIVAVTDLILFLGNGHDIIEGKYDYNDVKGYFVPAGTIVELYAYTLHFAPVQADNTEFVSIIILPKETNLPLENENTGLNSIENSMLFAKNKWLIAHQSSKQAAMGAHIGLMGSEINISL